MNLTLEALAINPSALPAATTPAPAGSGSASSGGFASALAAVQQASAQPANVQEPSARQAPAIQTNFEQKDPPPAMSTAKNLTATASSVAKATKKSASPESATTPSSSLAELPATLAAQPAINLVPFASNLGTLPATLTAQNSFPVADSAASRDVVTENGASESLQSAIPSETIEVNPTGGLSTLPVQAPVKNWSGMTTGKQPNPIQVDNVPATSQVSAISTPSATFVGTVTQTTPVELAVNVVPVNDPSTLDNRQAPPQLSASEARSQAPIADFVRKPAADFNFQSTIHSVSQPLTSPVRQPSIQDLSLQDGSLQQASPELLAKSPSTPQTVAAPPATSAQFGAADPSSTAEIAATDATASSIKANAPTQIAQLEAMPDPSARNIPGANPVNGTSAQMIAPAQSNPPLPAATAVLLTKMENAPSSASPNAATNTNPEELASQKSTVAGAKQVPAAGSTNLRTEQRSASSAVNGAQSSISDVSAGSASAAETPFSVFFSSPGSTESAAATLPNMLLPGNTASSHGGLPAANNPPSSQAGSAQSIGSAIEVNKDSLSGNQSAVTPPGTALRKDEAASGIQAASSTQPSATQVSAALSASSSAASSAAPPAASSAPQSSPVPATVTSSAAASAATTGTTLLSTPPAPRSVLSGQTTPSGPSNAGTASPQPLPNAIPGPVQMAQMVSRAGESEMRIGMNTSAFGSVEVRTTVHASDIGLTIGSEKGDLRSLLTNDMAAIANTLQQQNLRLSNLSFMQGFSSSSNGSNNGSNPQQQSFVPRPEYGGPGPGSDASRESGEELPFGESTLASSGLSILA